MAGGRTPMRSSAARAVRLVVAFAIVLALAPAAVAWAEPPQLTIQTPEEGASQDRTPSFTGTTNDSLDDVTVFVYEGSSVGGNQVEGSPLTSGTPLLGSWSAGSVGPLADGVYTAQASQTTELLGQPETGFSH